MNSPAGMFSPRARDRAVAVAAAAVFIYASVLCVRLMVRERAYYRMHVGQKTQLQRLPQELTRCERQIREEQDRLRLVQSEIAAPAK